MLEVTRESLQQRYADLVDTELLRRLRADSLTDLAREVALAELAQRGISAEAALTAAAVAEPAVDAELDFPADEFERNPYQAPRGAPAPASRRASVGNVFWWIYIAYIVLAAIWGLRDLVVRETPNAGMMAVTAMYGCFAVGLIAWRLRRPLLHSWLWVAALAVALAELSVGIKAIIVFLDGHVFRASETAALNPLILFTLLSLPMYWGIGCYAFASPAIWRRGNGRPEAGHDPVRDGGAR